MQKTKKGHLKRKSGRPPMTVAGNLKESILKAFFEVCYEQGVESLTLQKVADRSGVALATVRYHFNLQGNSLSLEALDYVSDRTYEWIDQGMSRAREKANFNPVQDYIHVMFDWVEKNPVQASYLVYFYYLCTTQMPLPLENKALVEIAQRRIRALVHEGIGMKLYGFSGDTLLMSEQIHTLVMGGCMVAATCRNAEFAQAQKQLCLQYAAQVLRSEDA